MLQCCINNPCWRACQLLAGFNAADSGLPFQHRTSLSMSTSAPPQDHPTPSPADARARALIGAHGGRATRTRIAVIEALWAGVHPLNHDEIVAALSAADVAHDRVTVYRALDWLVSQGIARRVAGGERAARFEICRDNDHHHAHFHCDGCGQIVCLDEVPDARPPALPAGFAAKRTELVVHGACADCSPRASQEAQA